MNINSAAEIGALVRSERKRRGWTQKDLADHVGVSMLWVSQFERGKPTAHIGLVIRTLKALNVKLWAGDAPEDGNHRRLPQIDLDSLIAP